MTYYFLYKPCLVCVPRPAHLQHLLLKRDIYVDSPPALTRAACGIHLTYLPPIAPLNVWLSKLLLLPGQEDGKFQQAINFPLSASKACASRGRFLLQVRATTCSWWNNQLEELACTIQPAYAPWKFSESHTNIISGSYASIEANHHLKTIQSTC